MITLWTNRSFYFRNYCNFVPSRTYLSTEYLCLLKNCGDSFRLFIGRVMYLLRIRLTIPRIFALTFSLTVQSIVPFFRTWSTSSWAIFRSTSSPSIITALSLTILIWKRSKPCWKICWILTGIFCNEIAGEKQGFWNPDNAWSKMIQSWTCYPSSSTGTGSTRAAGSLSRHWCRRKRSLRHLGLCFSFMKWEQSC